MFAGYNPAGIGLSQTHCILRTYAVLLLCFSQALTLLFRDPGMPGYNHFLSGILKTLVFSGHILSPPSLVREGYVYTAILQIFPDSNRTKLD